MAINPAENPLEHDSDTSQGQTAVTKKPTLSVVSNAPSSTTQEAPQGMSRRTFVGWGLAGLATLIAGPKAVEVGQSLWANYNRRKDEAQAIENRLLGPKPGETADWWQVLSEKQIKESAIIPDIDILGDQYVSTVSPELQAKAKQMGYTLIYQGDPKDTVGRTVIAAKGRQADEKAWTVDDLGFGRVGQNTRGIFKAWVPDPEDPNQQKSVYALVQDPTTKKEFLIAVQLFPFNPNADIRPTWFTVDNLNYGPEYIKQKSVAAGYAVSSDLVPSPEDPPSVKSKRLTDFPTLNDLLRKQGLSLVDLVRPGDYIVARMQTAGVDETKGDYRYIVDKLGVSRSIEIIVRRFGGVKKWNSEINNETAQSK